MRVGTAVIGTVLLAAGLGALLAGCGVLGAGFAADPVLRPAMSRFAAGQQWFWPVAGAVCEGVAFGGLVWAGVQVQALVRLRRPALDFQTRNLADVAVGELLRDVRLIQGVREARIRFTGSASRPRVRVHVTCDEGAVPARIHADLANGPVQRYRTAMEMEHLIVVLRFHMDDPVPMALRPVRASA
ncbi:hypothetical protein GCM10010191_56490 [Actinomadura vinacea]|uniref:Alkaline shock response membrane anchor protein AmaP n=1 Tax=Actinomadura vinacea TaxID=115336 RepID=A0ABN3JNC2_9ACTN